MCYCFPTFKDLSAFTPTRFLNGSAKVRAILFLAKLFFKKSKKIGVKIR